MPTATINLPDGTVVSIDGTPEEVAKLLQLYGGSAASAASLVAVSRSPRKRKPGKQHKPSTNTPDSPESSRDLNEIINLVKNCEEAEAIETTILDRVSQVNRILLPLYILHEHLDNAYGLTSGDISQITKGLGIPIHVANVSNTLSKTASKYVMGDRVRKKGQPVAYKLSRRGMQYIQGVLKGTTDD